MLVSFYIFICFLKLKLIVSKKYYRKFRIQPKRSIATTISHFEEYIECDENYCDKDQQKVPPLKIRKKNKKDFVKVSFLSKVILMNIKLLLFVKSNI